MRNIKFRAWNEDLKEMFYGKDICVSFDESDCLVASVFRKRKEQKEHLMQFIGLKDKNGQEIYEGDIVGYNSKMNKFEKRIVEWNKGEWGGTITGFEPFCEPYYDGSPIVKPSDCEALGNKFENPDLLEGFKDGSQTR